METERDGDQVASQQAEVDAPQWSRRQAIARMSAMATAAAAAWVAPEILMAKPADGAILLSGTTAVVTTEAGTTEAGTSGTPATTSNATTSKAQPEALAATGLDLPGYAEVGAALITGGWAMHHWSSRHTPAETNNAFGSGSGTETSTPAQ